MDEPLESQFDSETLSLVRRFEKMLLREEHLFFDVGEFEEIIEYYFYRNEQRKALETIQKSLDLHPGAPTLLLRLAQHHINTGKDREALRLLKQLSGFAHSDGDFHLAMGNLYSQLEKAEKAIGAYLKGLHSAEYPDEVLAGIAFEYENLGQYDKAIDYLLQALDANPSNEPALYELAFCCEVAQQPDRCIGFLLSFIDRNPYSAAAWFNLGIAYSNVELFEKAIEAYDYAIAIDETFSSAYFNKANCQANTGNYHQAIETYFETLFYEDPEPVTYYYIGECYEKLKDFEKSIDYYNKAVSLDPEFADAWMGLGISYDELGKPQSALPFIEKALRLSPGNPEFWFIQGDIQIKLSQILEGIASYRKVIELDPEDVDIWLDLSVVYADRKDFESGYTVLEEGLHHHAAQPDFYWGMAYYLVMMGKTNQGMEMFARAFEMDREGIKRLLTTFPEARNHPVVVELLAGEAF